jgi:hypothetical protein
MWNQLAWDDGAKDGSTTATGQARIVPAGPANVG